MQIRPTISTAHHAGNCKGKNIQGAINKNQSSCGYPGKQITEDEKLIIATLDANFTAVKIHKGEYVLTELIKLLAKNVTSFTKRYTPQEHPRIMRCLRVRSKRQVVIQTFTNQLPKGKGGKAPVKRQKVNDTKQRSWTYLQEQATSQSEHSENGDHYPYQSQSDEELPYNSDSSGDKFN